jgi:hypothetical protein
MDAAAADRGNALLLAHCASLDPAATSARERLDEALGADLARKLVWALCSGAPSRDESGLGARTVFAA